MSNLWRLKSLDRGDSDTHTVAVYFSFVTSSKVQCHRFFQRFRKTDIFCARSTARALFIGVTKGVWGSTGRMASRDIDEGLREAEGLIGEGKATDAEALCRELLAGYVRYRG